jgi:hypothetical protein
LTGQKNDVKLCANIISSPPVIDSKQIKEGEHALMSKADNVYEVLSPWAEADPVPLQGLAPRLDKLDGKKIGLLCNNKRAAPLILEVTEKLLKQKFPTATISTFFGRSFSVSSLEKDREQEFNDWLKGVDAVIAAVGD